MRVALHRLIIACLAATGCSETGKLTPTRGTSRTVLTVQQQQQESMLCVPTSIAMVMRYYGDQHSPREIKSLSAGKSYDPKAPFTDFTITLYEDAIRATGALGYAWAQRSFNDDDAGFAEGLSVIEDQLRAGHPILVDATLPSGHTFVIRGFDSTARQLFVVDPDQPAPGEDTISFDQFKNVWNEHAYGNNIRAAILTRPKE